MTAPVIFGLPVIDTIIDQLGGFRIFAMAFAWKKTMHNANMLTLGIAPALTRTAKGRATHVTIRLEASDLYTVETLRYPKGKIEGTVVGYAEGVYADSLRDTVEAHTGLRLSL